MGTAPPTGAGGNGEYMAVLNLGIDEALRGVIPDFSALCAGQPLQARGDATIAAAQ